ncbi:MAG: TlpA disulfide reductase family protein, partial [Candidatus Krumholzibacteria bacterium]|nr:TlpA disulfide reductase family protein [Candidatus Krumholzibacteria bacterium]
GGCGGGEGGGGEGGPDTMRAERSAEGLASVTLEGVEGPDRSIADYQGRILVVNLVATWNSDSKAIVEIMNEIQRKFRRNVTVIAVALDDRGVEGVRSFAGETGPDFDVFLGGDSAAAGFGAPRRFPTTFVLTRDAKVYAKIEGLKRYDYYHNVIISMFQKRM